MISLMVVPPIVMMIPLFELMSDLNLVNTYQAVIVIYAGLMLPFSIYLLTSFFNTIPRELLEAASIDGAGHLRTLHLHRDAAGHPGPGDAGHRQPAVGLERAAHRAGAACRTTA